MARTKKETSRIAWAGVESGLKMLVTPLGASAANPGLTRKVAAPQRKEAIPNAQRLLFFTFPSLPCTRIVSSDECQATSDFPRHSTLDTFSFSPDSRPSPLA